MKVIKHFSEAHSQFPVPAFGEHRTARIGGIGLTKLFMHESVFANWSDKGVKEFISSKSKHECIPKCFTTLFFTCFVLIPSVLGRIFHIYSACYLSILYSFRNNCGD